MKLFLAPVSQLRQCTEAQTALAGEGWKDLVQILGSKPAFLVAMVEVKLEQYLYKKNLKIQV